MRLSHLLLVLVTAFSVTHQASATERTRNLSGPRVHDEYTWPTIGHWKVADKSCAVVCELVIKPYSTHKAALSIVENGTAKKPIALRYQRDYIWATENMVGDYPRVSRQAYLYLQYENGKLYDEFGRVFEKVDD